MNFCVWIDTHYFTFTNSGLYNLSLFTKIITVEEYLGFVLYLGLAFGSENVMYSD